MALPVQGAAQRVVVKHHSSRSVLVDHMGHQLPAILAKGVEQLRNGRHRFAISPACQAFTVHIEDVDLLGDATPPVVEANVLVAPSHALEPPAVHPMILERP
jgi:hypothetical protein